MKILFLSHQAEFIYGGEVCTLAFMEELAKQGIEVHFASPAGPYAERARKISVWHEIPSRQFSRKISLLPATAIAWKQSESRLKKIIREEKIDLVHATSLKAMVYARSLGSAVPVVWHHHDILPKGFWNDGWAKFLAAGAALILAPSAATRMSLVASGINPGKVRVLHNGFPANAWTARKGRSQPDFLSLAFIGELSERKGVDLLPAIVEGCGRIVKYELLLVGDSVSDPAYGVRARELFSSFGESVKFLGRRNDIKEILQTVDILLVPSRQDPLPTVIVEAGLSGVPVIAAPVGGIPEMITDGENGFLAEGTQNWVDRVEELRDLRKWQKCSEGARRLAEERYDIQQLAASLIATYGSLLN
ncbi:MAG: glycosyltransferase family 4 protein [Bdellovibrionota bacterium]